jgi:hypothetical protein
MRLLAEIQTWYPSNTKQECYQLRPLEMGPFQQSLVRFDVVGCGRRFFCLVSLSTSFVLVSRGLLFTCMCMRRGPSCCFVVRVAALLRIVYNRRYYCCAEGPICDKQDAYHKEGPIMMDRIRRVSSCEFYERLYVNLYF